MGLKHSVNLVVNRRAAVGLVVPFSELRQSRSSVVLKDLRMVRMVSEHWLQQSPAALAPGTRVSLSLGALKPGTDPSLARKVRVASSSGRRLFFSALRICRSALALLGGVPQRLHPPVWPHLRVAVTKTAPSVDLVDPAPPASSSSVASSPLSRTEPKRVRASAGRGSGVRGAVPVRSSVQTAGPSARQQRGVPRCSRPCVRWSSSLRSLQGLPFAFAARLSSPEAEPSPVPALDGPLPPQLSRV